MNRFAAFLLIVCATGCAGQVTKSSAPGDDSTQPVDECTMGATDTCTQSNGNVGARACEPGQDGYVWGACHAATCTGAEMSCTTAESQAGIAQCVNGLSASACGLAGSCTPGTEQSVGDEGCESACTLVGGSWQMQDQPCDTPLVLAFHDERVAFTRAPGEFDLSGRAASLGTDWVSAETPWLAMDRDGNGRIDDGAELFGSMTELPGGARAVNGFAALAALDDDHDGQITAKDAAFAQLVVWRDADQDRRSSPGELVAAKDAGLVAIRLDDSVVPICHDGDCEVERATFVFRDETGREREGAVIDVHLARR
jgi:hypothetical protein